jgi:hypothetical protein
LQKYRSASTQQAEILVQFGRRTDLPRTERRHIKIEVERRQTDRQGSGVR